MRIVNAPGDLALFPRCVLVPTMGALHAGHDALVRRAAELARPRRAAVIVSVFVNPTQFNDPADFDRYPRTLDADASICASAGAHLLFAPTVDAMYPPGADVPVGVLPGAAYGPGLEDAFRPGHFAGVCQVVRRLFDLVRPAQAVFGEKDWQQLQVVRELVRLDGRPVDIVGHPTIREHDGLAMSSRNRFLARDERPRAAAVYAAIGAAGASGTVEEAERALAGALAGSGLGVEYAAVRDAASLQPLEHGTRASDLERPARTLVAARLGAVRLIDNAAWPLGAGPHA